MLTFSSMTAFSFLRHCSWSTLSSAGNPMPIMLRPAPMARVFCAILLRLISASLETGIGQSWTPSAAGMGLIRAAVQAHVPVHSVLIERNQQVEFAVGGADLVRAGADGQEGMAAANDGLIGVVDVEMEAAAAEDLRKNIAGSGHTLTSGASDTYTEGLPHRRLHKNWPMVSTSRHQRNI